METQENNSGLTRQGVKKASKHRIRNSYGVNSYYQAFLKTCSRGEKITWKDFSSVIKLMNSKIADELIESGDTIFPNGMGGLYVKVINIKPELKDGRVRGISINWPSTISLWAKDPEAKRDKILIRGKSRVRVLIPYRKLKAIFQWNIIFAFRVYRHIRARAYKKISEGHKYIFKDFYHE